MRIVKVSSKIIGNSLARPIISNCGQVLIAENSKINENTIRKFDRFGIKSVYIKTEVINDIYDIITDRVRKKNVHKFKSFIKELNLKLDKTRKLSVRKEIKLDLKLKENIIEIVWDLIKNINFDNKIKFVDIKSAEDYLYEHQINICILSVYMGKKLRFNDKNLEKLAIASLICDFGNLLLDSEKYLSNKILSKKEKKEFEKHTSLGYEFFHNETDFKITEIIPIIEHHERVNGSGYPRGINGDKMHIFSKIIAIADVYDALTSDRLHRPAFSQSDAVRMLMNDAGVLYDYKLTKLFVENIISYPIGTRVLLSTNDIGIVTHEKENILDLPTVAVITGERKRWIDLSKNKEINIERVIMTQ
ncbi:HD domain-containing phosphohydrolase [Clostridiaceae bacterium HSG29]|nr:HD domain-containing phosphohydrolase [Clostridiaceae bacterium HSG29]